MIKLSIIFNVLESYEVVRRHILYFVKLPLPEEVEVVFVDDGSNPPIISYLQSKKVVLPDRIRIIATGDERMWTQCIARNLGAKSAEGDMLLFSDIDHIVTSDVLHAAVNFEGDKMEFSRTWGVFDREGNIITDWETLKEYGLSERLIGRVSKPFNIFALKKEHFKALKGYEVRYAGRYGGEDVNFANKYRDVLFRSGRAKRSVRGPMMYVYPDPARDVKQVFHSLRRKK